MVLIWLIVTAISNAVNLTDGLDGLATGACVMVFGAYTLVNIWQNNQWCGQKDSPSASATRCVTRSTWPSSPRRSPGPASASCGGTPRRPQIFMGDTGSLALGSALAGFAILTRTELLLIVLGGLFVVETALGDAPGRLLQGHQGQTRLPDGPASTTTSRCSAGSRSRS